MQTFAQKLFCAYLFCAILGLAHWAFAKSPQEDTMQIRQIQIHFEGQTFIVTLENNSAARDFFEQLPLELKFSDYVGKEKIASLPQKLSAQEKAEYEPQIGDFFYFAPWGNVGIFYAKQPPYPGLIKLGEVGKNKSLFIQSIQSQKKDFVIYFDKNSTTKEN